MTDAKVRRDVDEALEHGARTIDRLRRENEILAIQARAFEAMANLCALLAPSRPMGQEVDAAWLMRKALEGFRGEVAESVPGSRENPILRD